MASVEVCRNRILSEDYRDLLLGWNENSYLSSLLGEDVCVQEVMSLYRVAYLPRQIADPINLERFNYPNIPSCLGLTDTEALNQAGITQIQNYPTLQLMGEGVMIGFVDTGIDYRNPIFQNIDGSTRIVGLWDQTIQTGTVPEPFSFGSNYTENQINEALESDDPLSIVPSVDENGHGTYVASVAAGGANVENNFLGAAPESSIAVVKLKQAKQFYRNYYYIQQDVPCYQENDVMLALKYLDNLAKERDQPLVICLALGTNQGGHNGHNPLGDVLDSYARIDGRVIVLGTGNEADKRHHYFNQIKDLNETKTVEVQVGAGVGGFTMELWTDVPNVLAATVISPSGEVTPVLPAREGSSTVYNFVFERTRLDVDYKLYAKGTHSQLIMFRFGAPAQGI